MRVTDGIRLCARRQRLFAFRDLQLLSIERSNCVYFPTSVPISLTRMGRQFLNCRHTRRL